MKTIAIIGSAGIPSKYGGFETFTEHLVKILHKEHGFIVFCSQSAVNKSEALKMNNVKYYHLPFPANGVFSIVYDFTSLIIALFSADIFLVLGCPAGLSLWFFRFFKKIIYHPDGLDWKRKRWKLPIRIFLRISNWIACLTAHKIIADNEKLTPYISRQFRNKVRYISYGGNHVKDTANKPVLYHQFLVLSRAVPENQLTMILDAFAQLPDKHLLMISNYKRSKYGLSLYHRYGSYSQIDFMEAIYDHDKLDEIRQLRRIYIHGHSMGGTNPSLVEAMWSGLPVICHDNDFNRHTTRSQAFYFSSAKSLGNMITTLTPGKITESVKNLQKIAKEEYTWERTGKEYSDLFKSF